MSAIILCIAIFSGNHSTRTCHEAPMREVIQLVTECSRMSADKCEVISSPSGNVVTIEVSK